MPQNKLHITFSLIAIVAFAIALPSIRINFTDRYSGLVCSQASDQLSINVSISSKPGSYVRKGQVLHFEALLARYAHTISGQAEIIAIDRHPYSDLQDSYYLLIALPDNQADMRLFEDGDQVHCRLQSVKLSPINWAFVNLKKWLYPTIPPVSASFKLHDCD